MATSTKNEQDMPSYTQHSDIRVTTRKKQDTSARDSANNHAIVLFENERVRVSDFPLPAGARVRIKHPVPAIR
ncbi:unnamed protein product [Amoebophrya sp. A25]|nr:unnamed protein product [Amoebophrya sp. A25]|eukprot:GSA25T00001508001.1